MSGFIFITTGEPDLSALDKATRDWEMRAARGECGWVCADCCCTFPKGMPDACEHGHQYCTDIIQRDKRMAAAEAPLAQSSTDTASGRAQRTNNNGEAREA